MIDMRKWYEEHYEKLRADYFHFLSFPSISTEPENQKDVLKCAEWTKEYLRQSGFHAELIPTIGYPIVFGELENAEAGKPTVLIYGHYDVQPVDPIELWTSPPFKPTEREGKVYARGAADDKGQIFYAMAALRALHEQGVTLPVNVKFCIEGEEEHGSAGLTQALPSLKEKFKTDSVLVVDFNSYDEKTPAVSLGARGIVTFDVKLTGSKGDLHSGSLGGIAYNPNKALVQLLSKLHHEDGRVAVEGFYDGIVEPNTAEKEQFPSPHDEAYYTASFGIAAFGGEKGHSFHESNVFRPTIEINGIAGGYFGPGFKTVIPAHAIAKLSCRLVPGQDPKKISEKLEQFLRSHCKKGMQIEVVCHGGAPAFRASSDSKLASAVAKAAEHAMGVPCKKMLAGGSVPVVAELSRILKADAVGMGYGLETDQIHAPNEHFDFHRFKLGFLTVAGALQRL